MTCPDGCKDQICHKNLGYCTEGCAEGYYFDEQCKECPDSCLSCTDGNTCIDCKAGYWGSHCQHHCPDNCYRCIDQGHCIDGNIFVNFLIWGGSSSLAKGTKSTACHTYLWNAVDLIHLACDDGDGPGSVKCQQSNMRRVSF